MEVQNDFMNETRLKQCLEQLQGLRTEVALAEEGHYLAQIQKRYEDKSQMLGAYKQHSG